jgi:MerR family transcriptional regulator, thiopeptide resistance regulator
MLEDATLTVGALAKASGLTVRTLHHWDDLGLLVPAERTRAGYRRYGPDEVSRLYRILALRGLGLSLDEIAGALDREGPDLAGAVRAHLARVEEGLAVQARLRDRLVRILDALAAQGEPSLDQLIDTIEVMTVQEKYYTPEQLEQLAERADALGEQGLQKAQQDWADLLAEVEAERQKGTDPGDPRMQELAGRWQGLIEQFTGGDPGIAASLKRMYESEGPETASRGAVSPELMAYAGEAVRLRRG